MITPEPYIETYTGRNFYFKKPDPSDIYIEDIAHALGNKCRFAGHCVSFYSVAEHSYIVSHLVPSHLALAGLLHDASEAYLEDIPTPIKPFMSSYYDLEAKIMFCIAEKFGFDWPLDEQVKLWDKVQLRSEAKYLMPSGGKDYVGIPTDKNGKVPKCIMPYHAEKLFLERYYELVGKPAIFVP